MCAGKFRESRDAFTHGIREIEREIRDDKRSKLSEGRIGEERIRREGAESGEDDTPSIVEFRGRGMDERV